MVDMREELVITLRAREEIGPQVRKAKREIDAFERKAEGSFKRVGRSAKKMTATFKKISGPISIASAAISAFGALVGVGMSRAAAEAEAVGGKFDVVFGELAGQTREAATQIAKDFQRSTTQVEKFFSTFQDTFVPFGFARDKAAELSEEVTKLSIDLASFNDELDTEALVSLQSALVGNHETVRRYGVIINETVLGQELLRMGIEGGTRSATEQEKVLARLNLITRGTKDAQGDAIRTAHEFNNTLKSLGAQVEAAKVRFGDFINDAILRAVDTIGGAAGLNQVVEVTFALVSSLSSSVIGLTAEFVRHINSVIDEMGGKEQVVQSIQDSLTAFTLHTRIAMHEVLLVFKQVEATKLGALLFGTKRLLLGSDAQEQMRKLAEESQQIFARYQSGAELLDFERLDEIAREMEALEERAQIGGRIAELRAELEALHAEAPLAAESQAVKSLDATAAAAERYGVALGRVAAIQDAMSGWTAPFVFQDPGGPAQDSAPSGGVFPTHSNPSPGLAGVFGAVSVKAAAAGAVAVKQYTVALEEARRAEMRLAAERAIADSFLDMATGARTAADAVRDLAGQLLRILGQRAVESFVTDSGIASILGFANGGVVQGGGFTGGGTMPVKGYANGGPIFNGPHIGIIGEGRYNEAAVPLPDGKSIPVTMTGGGSGETVNITFAPNLIDKAGVEELFARNGEAFAAVMLDQYRRNRAVSQTFGGRV